MSYNSETLEKPVKKQVVRPVPELVKLLKAKIREAREAAEIAAKPYQIEAGEILMEIRPQVDYTRFRKILRECYIAAGTADQWMRLAKKNAKETIDWEKTTMSKESGDHRPFARVDPDIKARIEAARRQMENFVKHERSQAEEREAERKLALRLIDIGYKILSKEMHPDKLSGSHEGMRRLNAVRARLKECV